MQLYEVYISKVRIYKKVLTTNGESVIIPTELSITSEEHKKKQKSNLRTSYWLTEYKYGFNESLVPS